MKVLALFLLVFALGFSATITVNDNSDTDSNDNKCTLREAIKLANSINSSYNGCTKTGTGGIKINFSGDMNITVGTALDSINVNLTIDGGTNKITIIKNTGGALFTLGANITLTLKKLNLIGGQVASVGANQTVYMDTCFVGNAPSSYVFVNNGGNINVVNTTFVNVGGVINASGGNTKLSFVTVKTSSTNPVLNGSSGNIFVKNSIFDTSNTCQGSITGSGVVYATNTTNCTNFTQKTAQEIGLDTLDFHGGNVKVYSLLGSSVAVNSVGDCSDLDLVTITKDARGKDRNKNGKKCDAGAFELLYNVNVAVSPSGAGSVSGAGEYEKDAKVNLQATENPGYEFEMWDGDCSGINPTYVINNLDADKSCTAKFKLKSLSFQKPVDTGNTAISGTIFVESNNPLNSARFIEVSINVPEGYKIKYSRAIEIEAVAITPNVTFRIIYPEPIKRDAMVYKVVGQKVYDITSMVDIRGSTVTFMIADNSIYDGNLTQGVIKDPIVILEPVAESTSGGGGGGCSTGGFGNSLLVWIFLLGLVTLRRFKG